MIIMLNNFDGETKDFLYQWKKREFVNFWTGQGRPYFSGLRLALNWWEMLVLKVNSFLLSVYFANSLPNETVTGKMDTLSDKKFSSLQNKIFHQCWTFWNSVFTTEFNSHGSLHTYFSFINKLVKQFQFNVLCFQHPILSKCCFWFINLQKSTK